MCEYFLEIKILLSQVLGVLLLTKDHACGKRPIMRPLLNSQSKLHFALPFLGPGLERQPTGCNIDGIWMGNGFSSKQINIPLVYSAAVFV